MNKKYLIGGGILLAVVIVIAIIVGVLHSKKKKRLNNTPVNNTPVSNTPVNNTPVSNTAVNNTQVDNTQVDNTLVDTPVDNMIDNYIEYPTQPVNKPVELLLNNGHEIIVRGVAGQCIKNALFNFTLPMNIKSLKLECKVATTRTPSDNAYIVLRNKTTGFPQHLRFVHHLLNTNWNSAVLTEIDLFNSGFLRDNVVPRPGHEIDIDAEACFPGWEIRLTNVKLIYEIK